MSTTLACPNCGAIDLDTLEVATCVAECYEITTDGPQFNGTTDYDRGEQTTIGVICNGCGWSHESEDWLTKLVPAGTDTRPRCLDCGEPCELADENDPGLGYCHAWDANDDSKHTARVEDGLDRPEEAQEEA